MESDNVVPWRPSFYRRLIGGDEVTARKDISSDRLAKGMSQVSAPAWAIAKREIKVLVRTPIYFFNSIGVILIAPLAMFLPLIWGNALEPILTMLSAVRPLYLNLGAAASIALVAAFAPAASTSFSREGKQFWLSQVMPVAPREQINGKIIYFCFYPCWVSPWCSWHQFYSSIGTSRN